MQRKKVSTGTNNAAAVLELDDDEQLIEEVTTTKKIGRQRRPPPPPAEEIIDADADDDDDQEPDESDRPYSDTSLAALLYGDGDEPLESQFCTVMIRRNPDSMNDRFLTPCGSLLNLAPMRNVELSAERIDIEERVRTEYGGGHYFFQLHFDNRLRSSWKATLADDPAAVAAAKAEKLGINQPAPAAIPAAVTPAVDPFDSFLDNLEKQKRMRDLLFGDERRHFEEKIKDLEAKAAAAATAPAEPKSEKLAMLEMALGLNKPELSDRVLDSIFPSEETTSRSTIAEIAALALEHKDTIIGLVGSLFGGIPQPAATPSIDDLLRQQPPTALPERKPVFNRHKAPEQIADPAPAEIPPPAPTSAEPPPPADIPTTLAFNDPAIIPDYVSETVIDGRDLSKGDETAIDAEITSEVTNAKPKRGRRTAAA